MIQTLINLDTNKRKIDEPGLPRENEEEVEEEDDEEEENEDDGETAEDYINPDLTVEQRQTEFIETMKERFIDGLDPDFGK